MILQEDFVLQKPNHQCWDQCQWKDYLCFLFHLYLTWFFWFLCLMVCDMHLWHYLDHNFSCLTNSLLSSMWWATSLNNVPPSTILKKNISLNISCDDSTAIFLLINYLKTFVLRKNHNIFYALFSIFKSIYFVFSLAYGNLYIHCLALFHHDHLICNLILPKKSFVFLNGERIVC